MTNQTQRRAIQAKKAQPQTKKAAVLGLLLRKRGVTLAEMMDATGWQRHTVRGFLSGTVGARMGLKVLGSGAGLSRVYRCE